MRRILNFISTNFSLALVLQEKFQLKAGVTFFQLVGCIVWWKLVLPTYIRFKFRFRGVPFVMYLNNRMDVAVLQEIFLNLEYDFDYGGDVKTIFDLGANIGDTAIFYSILFPQARIYAIEPNPHIFQKLLKNTKQFPNIKCFYCAIGDQTKEVKLTFGPSHLGSSIRERVDNTESVSVQMFSLSDFVTTNQVSKIDILKFDIEGAEEELLADTGLAGKVGVLVGEIHEDLTSPNIKVLIDNLKIKNLVKKQISKHRYIIFGQLN